MPPSIPNEKKKEETRYEIIPKEMTNFSQSRQPIASQHFWDENHATFAFE